MTGVILGPFAGSLIYVLSVLFLKQASARGVDFARTTAVTNWITAALFAGLWTWGGNIPEAHHWHEPVLTGLLFISGQTFTFLGLARGDVSIATPVLSSKIVMVALFSTLLLPDPVPGRIWLASLLGCVALVLLHGSPGHQKHHHVPFTIATALAAAASYAIFDVLVQKWSSLWGTGRYLPIMFASVAVFSCGFIPLFKAPLRAIPEEAALPLRWGAFCMGLQAICIIGTISVFGQATTVNVVYALRGLWSVLAVWLIGHWFQNEERRHGAGVLFKRLGGAMLLLVAILLVLIAKR